MLKHVFFLTTLFYLTNGWTSTLSSVAFEMLLMTPLLLLGKTTDDVVVLSVRGDDDVMMTSSSPRRWSASIILDNQYHDVIVNFRF